MTRRRLTTALAAPLAVVLLAAAARAEPTLEQLKASYDETVKQLQQSQDRKNQLASENEQLKARVAELEGKLKAIDAQARQAEFLRGQYVAWQTFIERYPLLLKRFQTFAGIDTPPATVAKPEPFFDPDWPFSAAARIEERIEETAAKKRATTMPALVEFFHGDPNHWCALCAAAASRKAELRAEQSSDQPANQDLLTSPEQEMMLDLPRR